MSENSEKHMDVEHLQDAPGVMRTAPRRPSRIANAGPAGIFAFASTTFILSMFNINVRGIEHPNVVVGMAIFSGGLLQFIAGMWEFPRGNVFGATAFSSYGAFWMSYATIFIPSSGILAAYPPGSPELASAIGIYLVAWFIITVIFIVPCLFRSVAFVALLTSLAIAFALLAGAQFSGMASVQKAGGVFGLITGFIAYYIGLSEMLQAEKRPLLRLPLGTMYVNDQ